MPKILLVEDSSEMRKLVRIILEQANHTVVEADNGQAGIEIARGERPDLILMDLSLPVMNGWDATRAIKSDPDLRPIPVVALTAHAMQGDREQALAVGCDGYLTKPIDDELLLRSF
jgi:two-component system cell cycle response regulator DivK